MTAPVTFGEAWTPMDTVVGLPSISITVVVALVVSRVCSCLARTAVHGSQTRRVDAGAASNAIGICGETMRAAWVICC